MFKKIAVMIALLAFSAPVYAADITSAGTTIGGAKFQPSSNVTLALVSTATNYSVASKHLNGTKGYASLDTDSQISNFDCDAGSTMSDSQVSDATTAATACTAAQ